MPEETAFPIGNSIWPGIVNVGGDADKKTQQDIRQLVTELAEYVALELEHIGLSKFTFPLFRPFNALFAITSTKLIVVISSLSGGLAFIRYMDWRQAPQVNMHLAVKEVKQQLGWQDPISFEIPVTLLYRPTKEREGDLKIIGKNFSQKIREELEQQQRAIRFNPIFRTPLNELRLDDSLCFVLMPFNEQFDRIFNSVIKPAIEKAGLKSLRSDQIFSPTPIVEDIWVHIASSKLVIADVTGKNPNVFYELGLAHAIGKTVIIITQAKEDIPFDIGYIRYFHYTDNEHGWQKLEEQLQSAISTTLLSS